MVDARDTFRASTRGPAGFLGIEEKYGSIEQGKIAGIIAVGGDPLHDMDVMLSVSVVIKDGLVYGGKTVPVEAARAWLAPWTDPGHRR